MTSFLQTPTKPDPSRDYVVSITRLKVRSPRAALAFFRRLGSVGGQMRSSPGLVVFGLRAQLLRMTFSTYGVFEDRRALAAFVRESAHGDAMGALRGRLPEIESRTQVLKGRSLPHDWKTIRTLLETPPIEQPQGEVL